jgi:hypothetical protein
MVPSHNYAELNGPRGLIQAASVSTMIPHGN